MHSFKRIQRKVRGGSRGTALLFALVLTVAMAGLCVALLAIGLSTGRQRVRAQSLQRSLYAAEAGLSDAYMQVTEGTLVVQPGLTSWVGTPAAPIALGPSDYWVEVAEMGSRTLSMAATGMDGVDQVRLELVMAEKPSGFFQWAAFGSEGVVLDSNAFIDSYDSALGPYASQVLAGTTFAKENGHVGSNEDILLKSNTEVHGDARPGPGHVVDHSAPNIYVSGTMDPLEEPFPFPPITPPVGPSLGSLVGSSSVVLGPGDIHYDSILMQGGNSLTIRGPARLVAGDFKMKSNTELIFDTSNGQVELYALADFVLESNSKVKTSSNSALDVTLFLSGDNMTGKPPDQVELGANADFVGAIYAPNAEFKLASNFDIFGSIMCRRLDLSSFGTIHFDEALLYDGFGATGEWEPRLWRRLPRL